MCECDCMPFLTRSGIIFLATDSKKNVNEVMVSALTIVNGKWDEKRKEVNEKLKNCDYSGIAFITHDNVRSMLNNSI